MGPLNSLVYAIVLCKLVEVARAKDQQVQLFTAKLIGKNPHLQCKFYWPLPFLLQMQVLLANTLYFKIWKKIDKILYKIKKKTRQVSYQ